MTISSRIRVYGPLLAIIVLFFGFQIFVLNLLAEKNKENNADISNTLWISAQLETEYLQFLNALDRYISDKESQGHEVLLSRLDILVSRLPLFLEGEKGSLFSHVEGAHETVLFLQNMIARLEPQIQALTPTDLASYQAIRREFDAHRRAVHKMVLDTFLADEAVTEQILERNDRIYWLLLLALGGIAASGTVLIVLLIRQVGRAEAAETAAVHEGNRAKKADEAKSEFLANMSHELRTPLNAIVGFTETMKLEMFGPMGDERYRGYVNDVYDCAKLLMRLIDDILDLSKIEAGKFALREENIDIAHIAEVSIRLFKQQAQSAELTLSLDRSENLPHLYGDPRAIQQIVLNLLSNAIKFTPTGGKVTITITCNADNALVLSITDTGIGLSEADLNLAMTPFGQVGSVMTRGYTGTGLGLPLAKSLVELHAGVVTIKSAKNSGTCVTVTFPPYRSSPQQAAA